MRLRGIATRGTTILLLGGVMAFASAALAFAHSGTQSYVYLDIYDSTVEGRVEYPISDLNEVLGLNIPADAEEALEVAEQNRIAIHGYTAEHFALLDSAGAAWPVVLGDLETLDASAGSYVVVNFEVDREFDPVPREFTASYDGIIHAKTDRDALLIIGTDWGTGTFNNEASELLRFTPNTTVQAINLGETSFWDGLSGVIALGAEHIRIGSDHILFIFALVIPSVLIFRRPEGWLPSDSFGSSLWRVLKIVTMFTVAHTITLTLGGLGIVEFPPALVETIIAISIVLAALHNLKPLFVNKEWIIAFGFGLFHGFGFAGLLSDLGLTQSRQFVSLLGFNLGIELGQALIIVMIFPALFLARRTRTYLPALKIGSVILIVVASLWALDRAFGVEVGLDTLVEAVLLWPRSLILVALLYVVAAGVYAFDRAQGRLMPMEPTGPVTPDEIPALAEV